jgi:class 3 adenylate cyclase
MTKIKVLFLAANPAGTKPLRLDEEIREITAKIQAAEHRDALELISCWAVRPDDLQQALLQHRPHIVHFSGHGTPGEIVLTDDQGKAKPVGKTALASLFKTLKDNVKVVVLNACSTDEQASAIVQHIDCAIGMNQSIGDEAAITFAASFYRALAFGRSVQEAFDLGRTALLLEGIPEENTPKLLARKRVKPDKIILVDPAERQATGEVMVPAPGGTEVQTEAVEKAVVVVDLSRYSDIGKELEQQFGVRATRELNAQVQGLIKSALENVGVTVQQLPYKNTGDGAIIALNSAEVASRFAEALHLAARTHNLKKDVPLAQRHFRVGIWTDTIMLDRQATAGGEFIGFEMAGTAIANAVRLEGACKTGEVLISPDTWGDLPKPMRKLYGDQEEVKGKRGERFKAHRRKVVDPAPWEDMASSPAANPTKPPPAAPQATDRLALLKALNGLSPTDLATLVIALPGAHVSRNATVPEQVAELVRWVESSTGPGLAELQRVVREVLPNFR